MRKNLFFAAMTMVLGCGDSGTSGSGGSGGQASGGASAGGEASTGGAGTGGSAGGGDGCVGLCTQSGFDDGDEMDFGGGLIECYCSGASGAVTKSDCEAYCAGFGVGPADSLLSMTNIPDDKCVCDGT